MTIFSDRSNCYKAVEVVEDNGEFNAMIQGMKDRGVSVRVIDSSSREKKFCLD